MISSVQGAEGFFGKADFEVGFKGGDDGKQVNIRGDRSRLRGAAKENESSLLIFQSIYTFVFSLFVIGGKEITAPSASIRQG